MNNFNDAYIDRYLLNELTPNERTNFKQQMELDFNLQEKVQIQKKIMQATKLAAKAETELQIKSITKNWQKYVPELATGKKTMQGIKKQMLVAEELLVSLINQFFTPFSVSFRNVLSEKDMTLEDRAVSFYTQKNYKEALPLLKQLPETNKEAQLMLGNALFISQQYEAAYQQFEQLIQQKPIGYLTDAKWYAGLVLLQLNRTEEAIAHFKWIADDENSGKKMKRKTLEILTQLEV